jgi:hypothetical protein
MKNKVKYAPVRKYRDVGFNETPENEIRKIKKRPLLLKKKESFFKKVKRVIKNIFKK